MHVPLIMQTLQQVTVQPTTLIALLCLYNQISKLIHKRVFVSS